MKCFGKSTCSQENVAANGRYADDLFVNLVLQFMFQKEADTSDDRYYPEFGTGGENIKVDKDNGCSTVLKEDDIPSCTIDFEH